VQLRVPPRLDTADAVPTVVRPRLPVCPFATRGVDDLAIGSCPGFDAAVLSFAGAGAGESIGRRRTCAHLDVQRGARGWTSACTHPAGLPDDAARLAALLPRVRSRRTT
jgi:hypothetical protein